MRHSNFVLKLALIFLSITAIWGCADNEPPGAQETFEVSFSRQDIQLVAGASTSITYEFIADGEFSITPTLVAEPETALVSLDNDTKTISITALETLGSDKVQLLFASTDFELEAHINYTVVEGEQNVDPDPEEETDKEEVTSSPYWMTFPTDYITVFEQETVTIQLRRNYEPTSDVVEHFYINTHNVEGIVNSDGTSITLEALGGDEDTYGEISVVTDYQGVRNEHKMQVLYFNKNRDLRTTEPPVIALLNPDITIEKSSYIVKNFDVYDPDSDRISYRVLSAPANTTTHINRAETGYQLTINAMDSIDPDDNKLVLQVSDAHNTDTFEFNLISEVDSTSTSDNQPPAVYIEKNVILSPLVQFSTTTSGATKTLAFAYKDFDEDRVSFSMMSSNPNYEFRLSSPFIEVTANDISELQHDQITLIAEDGHYQSRLTFHFYIKDNYKEFLGGNPNTAPLIEIADTAEVLETKTISLPFESADFEQHDYEISLDFDDSLISAEIIGDTEISITANAPESETSTTLTITLEDVFESKRDQDVDVTIYKNTPPTISFADENINMVEGTLVYKNIEFIDPDQDTFEPAFEYDDALVEVSYRNEQIVVKALDIDEDQYSEIIVSITDEFGQQASHTIPLTVRFLNPDNAPPTITFSETEFEVLPGRSGTNTVTISDPDNDPLSIEHVSSSEYLTYDYTQASGNVEFTVSEDSPFNVDYQITFTVSDGVHLVELPMDIRIATAPEAPILTLAKYNETVEEESSFLINFDVVDYNGDEVEISVLDLPTAISVDIYDDYIEVFAPEDISLNTTYQFTLLATDETGYTDSELISFVATPVNDAPTIELASNTITLVNTDVYALTYNIIDVDSGSHEVEVPIDDAISDRITASVFPGLKTIYLNGFEKGDVGNFILNVTVKDGIAYSEQNLEVYLTLDNAAPVIRFSGFEELVPWIEMSEQSTREVKLSITDPDGDTRTSLDGDVLAISCASRSNNLVISKCALDEIEFSTLDVTEDETGVAVTVTVTDGFEDYPSPNTGQSSVQFKVDILAN